MNGRKFLQAIGCIPSTTSSIKCDLGHAYFFLTQHLLDENRAMLQDIKGSVYKCLSCRNVLKRLRPWDLTAMTWREWREY